jgi:uncharacterized protein (TIGR03067 family)
MKINPMILRVIFVLPLFFLIIGCAKKHVRIDISEKIEGDWLVTQLITADGSQNVKTKKVLVQFSDGNFTIMESTAAGPNSQTVIPERGTYDGDAGKDPWEIDIVTTEGPDQGKLRMGVVALEGNELKMALAGYGQSRPKKVSVGANVSFYVMTRQ